LMAYQPLINKFLVPEVPADKLKNTLIHYRLPLNFSKV